MEPVIIRKATLNDLPALLSFEQQIIKTERPLDITIQPGDIHYYDLAQMVTAPNVAVMVAESNCEIIGSGYARIEESKIYLKHKKHGYLGFMYVVPEHRGKGVNQKIIEALKRWCALQDVFELRLEVYNDNLPAIKAYEKVGFVRLMVEMRLKSEN